MLLVGKDLASYTLAAGEPFVLEVQLLDSAGRGIDLDDQAMVLTFYTAGTRALVTDFAGAPSQYEGERLSDTTGEYFRWAFDGRWSDAMLNKPGLRVELAQRLFYGRRIISTGTLSVVSSAAIVPSLPGGSIALTAVRVTIKDNAVIGGAPVITQTVILYDGPSVPIAAPVFTTPTSIASDGTPQVGELLTGIDGVATNAASYTRRWLLGSTVLTSSATYTPTEVGSYRYETIATGPGGDTTSGSNITVAAASPVLGALTLSPTTATAGTSATLAIIGATAGSVITGTVPAGMTLNSAARTITGTPTTAGSPSIVLTETLAGATGSPRQSTVGVTIAAAPVTPSLGALTVTPSSATVGTAYSGTINGLTSGSSIALSGAGAAGLSIAGAVITGTPTTAGAVNIIETLAGATGSPRTSSGVVTVTAAAATPDGPEEATISPANTTLRSTYDFTKTGTAYSLTKNAYNGNGVYWPNKPRRLLVPNPAYPDLFISYYTPDHGDGASGFFAALCNGDPTVLSNWRTYDDVKASTDWLSHLSNLPAANPILVGPQAQLETICIIPYNGKWIFHGQMTSIPGAPNQGTVRAITTDGFNFTLQNVSLLVPSGYGDGHTGYLTGGANPFPGIIDPGTGIKALYACWSLHGGQSRSTLALWATDNPETGTWRLVQTFGKIMGRNALGSVGNWFSFAFINMDWGSIRQTRQGWAFLTEGAARGSGASARPGDMYEVLVGDDGRTMLGRPQLVLARGGTGTLDNGEVSRGETFIFANKRGFIYEAADSTNTKVAAIATSPLRNPANTWFETLTPAIPTFATKQVNFQTASAIPAGFTAVTTGTPAITYSASGAAIAMAPNDAYFLFENDGFDPTTTDYVDIFLDDFKSTAGGSTGARIPYIGFATSKTARSAMTDAFYLSNGEGTAGTMSYSTLVAGTVTGRVSDYVWGIGYVANTTQTTAAPKHKGIRWFPKTNEAFVLEEGAEGEPIKTNTINYPALLDKTKRYYPFIGFVSTGTASITEQVGKMIVRVADSGGMPATPTMNIGNDVSQSEGNSGTTNYNYTVTRSSTTGATSAAWSVAGSGSNPASASDFVGGTLPSGTINFADGAATATITVPVAGDTTVETDESFTVSIVPPSGYTSTRAAAGGSIINDDAPPSGTPATMQSRYQASNVTNLSAYSFAAVPLGTEAATRKLRAVGSFRFAAATAAAITATFTPDGGSAIAMTQIGIRKSTYDAGESVVIGFTVDVPTGTQGTVLFTLPSGAVRGAIDTVCTVNAATTPSDVQSAETVLIAGGAATITSSINKTLNGVVFGTALYSVANASHHSSAAEVPTASETGAPVTFTNNNSSTATWTGIANPNAGMLLESTGSGGNTILLLSFNPI